MKSKALKIKIPAHDLASFGVETLIIDPFWYDLYGIEPLELEEEEEEYDKNCAKD